MKHFHTILSSVHGHGIVIQMDANLKTLFSKCHSRGEIHKLWLCSGGEEEESVDENKSSSAGTIIHMTVVQFLESLYS